MSPSDPLFSCIITLYTLLLLYFPHIFLRIFVSPVLIITATLLISLLRLGSIQRLETKSHENRNENRETREENRENPEETTENKAYASEFPTQEPESISCKPETEMGFDTNPGFEEYFVEWNVRAPLEVIYEAYEGEEEEQEERDRPNPGAKDPTQFARIEKFPSLALYYPESDSDSSSDMDFLEFGDGVSPENVCFRWEEDYREGLVEISLDRHHCNKSKQIELDFHGEEENLIEIDLSRVRDNKAE